LRLGSRPVNERAHEDSAHEERAVSEPDIRGLCPPGCDMVRTAFADNFARGEELGARFTLTLDGEVVVDLMGGFADRARTRPFAEDTLTPIFSTMKAVAAIMIARLVDQGRLDYGQRVAEVWPEFGQAGKDRITVEQVLSHQAGLPGFLAAPPGGWFDWDAVCKALAAMKPLWEPGTASGYHPVTFGFLVGEIFRRVDGRTLGRALRDDIAEPFGLDLWIGLPEAERHRAADVVRPNALPKFGPPSDALKAAFLSPWSTPKLADQAELRETEVLSSNGYTRADSLALIMSALARDGSMGARDLLSPGMTARLAAERIRGQDLVLPYEVSWGAGVMRNAPNMFYGPTPDSFGHSGWGGSCAFADPSWGLACAYVMNRQSPHLIGDPRSRRLIDAVYASL
jgi:CubicO group peptidase (beta-lactamase class C family)